MSPLGRRIQLEVLAFAAQVLLLPSAVILGAMILMLIVLGLGTGLPLQEHPIASRVLLWFLPPEAQGSYRGSAAAGFFIGAFLKANLVLYLASLPIRLALGKRLASMFRFNAIVLLAFTVVLAIAFVALALSVEFTNGGNVQSALGGAGFILVGYLLALPYLGVLSRIHRAIDELGKDD